MGRQQPSTCETQAYEFPDGSEIEFTVRTDDSRLASIFTGDVAKRMAQVRSVLLTNDVSLTAFKGKAPADRGGPARSTTTHALPAGEVTVSIDATGRGIHGYLYHLVRAAVAYTHTVDLDVPKTTVLATALLGLGVALLSAGHTLVSLPLLGAGGSIGLHLAVYLLSAHGIALSLSRVPDPLGPAA